MRNRKFATAVLSAAALAGAITMAPGASAACAVGSTTCADTAVAATVATGTLSLSAVAAASGGAPLGSATIGSGATPTVLQSADLTLTTVTDTRTNSTGWTVTGSITDFTGTAGTIAKAKTTLTVPAAATAVLGTLATQTRSTGSTPNGGSPVTLITVTTTGVNTVTYTPRVAVDVNGAAPGLYTATVTQSVA